MRKAKWINIGKISNQDFEKEKIKLAENYYLTDRVPLRKNNEKTGFFSYTYKCKQIKKVNCYRWYKYVEDSSLEITKHVSQDDHNDQCKAIRKENRAERPKYFEAKEILSKTHKDGQLMYEVKYKGKEEKELLEAKVVHVKHPQLLISFLEEQNRRLEKQNRRLEKDNRRMKDELKEAALQPSTSTLTKLPSHIQHSPDHNSSTAQYSSRTSGEKRKEEQLSAKNRPSKKIKSATDKDKKYKYRLNPENRSEYETKSESKNEWDNVNKNQSKNKSKNGNESENEKAKNAVDQDKVESNSTEFKSNNKSVSENKDQSKKNTNSKLSCYKNEQTKQQLDIDSKAKDAHVKEGVEALCRSPGLALEAELNTNTGIEAFLRKVGLSNLLPQFKEYCVTVKALIRMEESGATKEDWFWLFSDIGVSARSWGKAYRLITAKIQSMLSQDRDGCLRGTPELAKPQQQLPTVSLPTAATPTYPNTTIPPPVSPRTDGRENSQNSSEDTKKKGEKTSQDSDPSPAGSVCLPKQANVSK